MSDIQQGNETEIIPTQPIILTDLDGTLLDHSTYEYTQAQPALDRTAAENIPVIPVTSKTWAEVNKIRANIESMKHAPALVENGGGVIVPKEYLQLLPNDITENAHIVDTGENWVIEIARPIAEARTALDEMTAELGIPVESFGNMTPEEFSQITGLSVENAELALQRQFQEGFRLVNQPSSPEELKKLREAMTTSLQKKGFNLTQGGRFWQVTGGANKGAAVEMLKKILTIKYGKIHVIGLGDASGDIPALEHCDEGYLVANPQKLEDVDTSSYPHIKKVNQPGPEGWNSAVNSSLDRLLTNK